MPSALVSTEIVVGTLVVVAVVVLATTFLRRRYIAKGLPLTLCGMRRSQSDRWRLGLIRFGDNALEWYSLGGVSVRPKHRWLRQRLLLDVPEPLRGSDSIPLLPGCEPGAVQRRRQRLRAGPAGPAYTALRSWQEAAPPGYNVNVA